MFLRRCLARLNQDLLPSSDCLLGFLLLDSGGGAMGLFNELGRLSIGLQQDLLALSLSFGQFGSDLLCVGKSLSDLSSPLFQHLEDWLVGKPMEKQADDGETECLAKKRGPCTA